LATRAARAIAIRSFSSEADNAVKQADAAQASALRRNQETGTRQDARIPDLHRQLGTSTDSNNRPKAVRSSDKPYAFIDLTEKQSLEASIPTVGRQ